MTEGNYKATLSKITLTDQQKQKITTNSINPTNKPIKNRRKHMLRICYCCVAFVLIFGLGWGINGGIINMFGKSPSNENSGKALTPHIKYNDVIFWNHNSSNLYEQFPAGYKLVGSIKPNEKGLDTLSNFGSNFGKIGTEIYANSDKPHSLFIQTEDKQRYLLFISQILRGDILMYEKQLYGNTGGIMNWYREKPWDGDVYEYAGSVNAVVYDEIPSYDFQSNIGDSEGGKIYISADKNIIYLEITEYNQVKFIKLRKNDLFLNSIESP